MNPTAAEDPNEPAVSRPMHATESRTISLGSVNRAVKLRPGSVEITRECDPSTAAAPGPMRPRLAERVFIDAEHSTLGVPER
jgi:hypothetical protein